MAWRAGDTVLIMSKSGKPLGRYFPELVAILASTGAHDFVLDGEIILPVGDVLSFDALQARLHPAASRIARLSRETPAQLMLFDCLALDGVDRVLRPLNERRVALEQFHAMEGGLSLLLSPATADGAKAQHWLDASGGALDGVVAKRLDQAYQAGERAMLKVKQHRTADCVVGGFRRGKGSSLVASLLLGLYDEAGKLNHVGFTSAIAQADKPALTAKLEPLIASPGFTGKTPGGPSRWNNGRESEWEPLRPDLVAEVVYDQVTGDRFRHGTAFMRWRPDKVPKHCRMDQLDYAVRPSELEGIIAR